MLTAELPRAPVAQSSVREVERKLAQVNVGDGDHDEHCRFFVYCKKCKRMAKGKLRVRCVQCRDPAFVLNTVSISHSCVITMLLLLLGAPGLGRCTCSSEAAGSL